MAATEAEHADRPREPLAIVGIGCRFPGDADSPDEFWQLLREGRDAVTDAPRDPARAEMLEHPDAYPHGAFLRAVDGFDWRAFHTAPREARFMDPQQRLALEVSWEAFEDAGLTRSMLAGRRAAVVVGIMWPDYAKLQAGDRSKLDGYAVSGSGFAYASNRISAFFDLTGPSFSLDAMCASSLVAVHLACQSIWSGESELALAAGVNLILTPDTNIGMTRSRILSPDGRCKTFDAAANGFVRGEGAGAIVIRRANDALADGDRVIALIRGTAVRHSGESEWIMAPSRDGQVQVINDACRRAGIRPAQLDYVELHGTGTVKGDPVEAQALGDTVGQGRPADRPCRVGSVKTNVGHLDSAAGIAGLIKAALSVHHGQIPPSLHFHRCNPAIDLERLGLAVQTRHGDWPNPAGPRLAGVTGLSFGGANAHIVLEGPPAPDSAGAPARSPEARAAGEPLVLPVSAETPGALDGLVADYARVLRSPEASAAADVAYTASRRRTHRPLRVAVVGATAAQLADELERRTADGKATPVSGMTATAASSRAPAFVFSGQGCSWAGMGRELLAHESAFAAVIDTCDAVTRERAGWSLRHALASEDPRISADGDPTFVQPALCGVQLALAGLWESWGITPGVVVGHSVGEIAAAGVAGALSSADAMALAIERGRVMAALHGRGRTAQVGLSEERTAHAVARFSGRVWIAGINAPEATVIAGEPDAVEAIVASLRGDGVPAAVLPVRSAFHGTGAVQEAAELRAGLRMLGAGCATTPMISTLSARPVEPGELDAGYWARQLVSPVRLLDAVARVVADGHHEFVEIGPHPVLRSSLAATLRAQETAGTVLESTTRGGDGRLEMRRSLARLYERGHEVNWPALYSERRRSVALPRYRWQRERLWLDAPRPDADAEHPLLGRGLRLAHAPGVHVWERSIDARRLPYLLEHRVDGLPVLPASAYVELGLAAARALGWTGCRFDEMRFARALTVPTEDTVTVQTLLARDGDAHRLEIRSGGPDEWRLHASAMLSALGDGPSAGRPPAPTGDGIPGEECYARFARQGVDYGLAFRGISRAWPDRPDRVLAQLQAPAGVAADMGSYVHHPAVLDAYMHVVALAAPDHAGGFMPTTIESLSVHGPAVASGWSEVTVHARDASDATADLRVCEPGGRPVVEAKGVVLRALAESPPPRRCTELRWRALARAGDGPPPEGRWLVLADRGGIGQALADALRRGGATVTVAFPGDGVPATTDVTGVLHLWSLDVAAGAPAGPAAAAQAQALAFGSVLELARSSADAPLWLVTRGAQSVETDDVTHPLAALAWGAGRTLSQEAPDRWGGLIDLDPREPAAHAVQGVLACLGLGAQEDQFALRGRRMLVPRLAERALRASTAQVPPLRHDGAYLVTGAFGGLGSAVCQWLAHHGAGQLVLVGRHGVPPRRQWPALDDADPATARTALIRWLERAGATVHVAAVDVAQAGALEAAMTRLRGDGLAPMRGVVHAAGVSHLAALDEVADDTAAAILSPKLEGSLALASVLAREPLEFFALFSSISALIGSPRMGPYAAANAFQGALASHCRALGLPTQALYWGAWADAGMARGSSGGPLSLRGQRGLATADGLALLGAALADGAPEVALLDTDWAQWTRFYPHAAAAPVLRELVDAAGAANGGGSPVADGSGAPDGLSAAPERSAPGGVVEHVSQAVADVLHVSGVAGGDSLADLGFDSLMATELRIRIERELGIRVPMLALLQSQTIGALAEAVAGVAASGNGNGA